MRRVLATDFSIWPATQNLHLLSDSMVKSPDHWARLANYLILYDQIVIPTGKLQILPVLRIMLGDGIFEELIADRAIVLARFDRCLAYAGGGGAAS